MSVYQRESFGDFIAHVIRIREAAGRTHELHAALMEGRSNDEETVASIASTPSDAVRTRKALRTIHSDFPYGANVPDQCAYLLRAFIGLDAFGDNDTDTGWAYLHDLLEAHGWGLPVDGRVQASTTQKLQRQMTELHPAGFQRRHVLDRDASFDTLRTWFDKHLHPTAGADQHL